MDEGPRGKDPVYQRPKREMAEAGSEKPRKGGLASEDSGARGPNSKRGCRPVRQPQGLVPGTAVRKPAASLCPSPLTMVKESEWLTGCVWA